MRLHLPAASAALIFGLGACGESTPPGEPVDDFGYKGTGIGVTIAPLDLPGVTDACYSFEIRAGADPGVAGTGERVVARGSATGTAAAGQGGDGGPTDLSAPLDAPLCSNRFGNSQGAISYVAPCDASPGNETHNVTLWVNAVCQNGTGIDCTGLTGYVNPCGPEGCTVTAECVENADVPVTFNFTIMASAQQGFFDIAVNFSNIFCSAKLDTCYDVGDADNERPINLLFDESGNRAPTAVLALACTAGPGADNETFLHVGHVTVTCGAEEYVLEIPTTAGGLLEGNQTPVPPLRWALYFGSEDLSGPQGSWNKEYFNVAITGFPEGCSVSWAATATSGPGLGLNVGAGAGVFNAYPVINYGPQVITGDLVDGVPAWNCDDNPLNDDGSTVVTDTSGGTSLPDIIGGPCVTINGTTVIPCDGEWTGGGDDDDDPPPLCDHPCTQSVVEAASFPWPGGAGEYCFSIGQGDMCVDGCCVGGLPVDPPATPIYASYANFQINAIDVSTTPWGVTNVDDSDSAGLLPTNPLANLQRLDITLRPSADGPVLYTHDATAFDLDLLVDGDRRLNFGEFMVAAPSATPSVHYETGDFWRLESGVAAFEGETGGPAWLAISNGSVNLNGRETFIAMQPGRLGEVHGLHFFALELNPDTGNIAVQFLRSVVLGGGSQGTFQATVAWQALQPTAVRNLVLRPDGRLYLTGFDLVDFDDSVPLGDQPWFIHRFDLSHDGTVYALSAPSGASAGLPRSISICGFAGPNMVALRTTGIGFGNYSIALLDPVTGNTIGSEVGTTYDFSLTGTFCSYIPETGVVYALFASTNHINFHPFIDPVDNSLLDLSFDADNVEAKSQKYDSIAPKLFLD